MNKIVKEIFSPSMRLTLLAVLASFIFGGVLIAFSSANVQAAAGYLFARPGDFFIALWNAVFGAYDALFRGSIFNYKGSSALLMIKPITETLAFATPITLAGLGLARDGHEQPGCARFEPAARGDDALGPAGDCHRAVAGTRALDVDR